MSKKYYEKLLSDIQNQSKPVESKFGSYILKKFGWEIGKGLGKHENGEVDIMKIKKYGEHGLGYKEHEEKENEKWWENMYNKCAQNIKEVSHNRNSNNNKDNLSSTNDIKLQNDKNENIKYSIFIKKDNSIISTSNNQESIICNLEKTKLSVIDDERKKKKKKIKIKDREVNKKRNRKIIDEHNTKNTKKLKESDSIVNDKKKMITKKEKEINKELNNTESLTNKKKKKIKKRKNNKDKKGKKSKTEKKKKKKN
ncbi:conserved Plasmodium protein, unknown function [Plasmodium relictum]|uniref:G-patch domain-containing protein n=1 Tax=Plasmodium relictum TaxID=85471 RepID=A0A1J1H8Q4_PLARL|nr:conserved Plasmodium protein, unknown function [Plasmodium relictum]CRG99973.1 conserved Plasmodium protein, unknown function [Plasmodium relictum]